MKDWAVLMIFLLTGLVACGREEGPPPMDIEAIPSGVSKAAQGNGAISEALKNYIVTTDKRLKEHVIQVDGLKFMTQSDPAMASTELQKLTLWMEDSLADAQEMLGNLRVAQSDRVESMRADLEALIRKMDERYEVAMGLTRTAYKSMVDDELGGDEEGDKQSSPPALNEGDFDPESELFK